MPPPRATTHAPLEQPCTPPRAKNSPPWSNHTCPPSNHACPPGATMHAPPPPEQPHMPQGAPSLVEQPCTPPPPEQPRMPPLWTECGHTLLKILPCPNFVAGGNNRLAPPGKSWICHCTSQALHQLVCVEAFENTNSKQTTL